MKKFFIKIFNKVFSNDHSMPTNTVFFTLLLMLLYVLVLLPFMIFFFIENPNMFQEAETEIYLNKNELYRMARSMELYSGFFIWGAVCEIVRRAISTKVSLLNSSLFTGYLCLIAGQLCELVAYWIMLAN